MAYKTLELKIGTHVMCIANISLDSDIQIANGSQGIVVGFNNNLPLVKFNNINNIQSGEYAIGNLPIKEIISKMSQGKINAHCSTCII